MNKDIIHNIDEQPSAADFIHPGIAYNFSDASPCLLTVPRGQRDFA